MEVGQEELFEPLSPNAQYMRSPSLSLTVLAVLEFEGPIDDPMFILPLIKDVFLPTNSRFSSIVVTDNKGVKKWKKVAVNLKEHVHVPIFPTTTTVEYYDECLTDYLTKIAMEELPENRPLWEIHVFKYPTKNAAGNLIFKLHHSLGDGYSIIGILLSCFQRADNHLLPLTFPSRASARGKAVASRRVPRFFTGLVDTVYDFGWSLIKSNLIKDDESPIRSGIDGVEFKPFMMTTTTFSIDQLKEITSRLNVSINDLITGVITFATRLYMQETSPESGVAKSTAVALLNTRGVGGYKSVKEMIKTDAEMPWGNRFAFLHVPIPELTESGLQDPLRFVKEAQQIIKRQRNSAAIYLTGLFLDFIRKIRGPKAAARYMHATLNNTSLTITNLIGPMERVALDNLPISGFYFFVAGSPQSLQVTILSYAGRLRVAVMVEKGFMDPQKMKSCINSAFQIISKAAVQYPNVT